ncbi:ATPase family protein associated with various cellular activities (AAA) [Roseinatronobacter thiooxidans]|uniref:ATPase family protein associated with various cellular activities (AAA) n=1 Tax=Roseinatronobacter thiooxidans TaxID=121821 RepID=A0A2W7PVV7_9RHOB|nr:ATP-binding protein [Roseinatronobacter thiooxidans]PZX39586.1 ATPase family protein associated with various cellular activities (AAA) [Roseinatronobacter thiooxidans]
MGDVYGQPEAVTALHQVVRDLEEWRAGRLDWNEVTKSFLLAGPPGTRKTLLAQALAGTAGITFVKTSYSDCQRYGHQGDFLRELNASADRASAGAPCVWFLDNIDSFHRRGQLVSGYMIGVINGLRTLLDRLSATEGVILIAATNDVERVDRRLSAPDGTSTRFDVSL